jgi:hypothetical protein
MRLRRHLLRNLTRLSISVAIAIGVSGCGGKTAAKTNTSAHARVTKLAPAYRVGQYCLTSREAKYRVAGLSCRRHHLARL